MGRHYQAGFAGETVDHEVVAAQAWSAAFDDADISAALDQGLDVDDADCFEGEDDLHALIALRPSRRQRPSPLALASICGQKNADADAAPHPCAPRLRPLGQRAGRPLVA